MASEAGLRPEVRFVSAGRVSMPVSGMVVGYWVPPAGGTPLVNSPAPRAGTVAAQSAPAIKAITSRFIEFTPKSPAEAVPIWVATEPRLVRGFAPPYSPSARYFIVSARPDPWSGFWPLATRAGMIRGGSL